MRYIDFRSDTVTKPTEQMRAAMAAAEVGDDVFGDDPTVNRLQQTAATILGKEAALFVPSGTHGNQCAIMSHTHRGDAIVVGEGCHIQDHEAGAYAVLSGVSLSVAKAEGGIIDPLSVERLITDDSDVHVAKTGLVCVENAYSNGAVLPVSVMRDIYVCAKQKGIPVHLDGARLFNAAAALDVDVKVLTGYCDSVMCCLSKGLCSPMGSILAGSAEFIHKAKRNRKILGGAMRQVGVVAAAGIIALTEMTERLKVDHQNAKFLARQLSTIEGFEIDPQTVDINMVFYRSLLGDEFDKNIVSFMLQNGIKITSGHFGQYRMVTNNDVTTDDCIYAAEKLKQAAQQFKING